MMNYISIIRNCLLLSFSFFVVSCKKNSNETTDSYKSFDGTKKHETLSFSEPFQDRPFDYLPTSTTNQIIKHSYYILSYVEDKEQAEWVAYELEDISNKRNQFSRPFFIKDPKVVSGSADWKNYKKSGYDKGHLCPAGDMTFNKKAYDETFFTSNISPQLHEFNDGVWNKLEQKTRYWSVKYKKLYIITGGILSSNLKTIGVEKVAVPNYFYKIIGSNFEKKFKMIAFLVPNAKSEKPLYDFVVSVDSIEKMTGIDFFPKLEDKIEANLEKSNDYKDWSFN